MEGRSRRRVRASWTRGESLERLASASESLRARRAAGRGGEGDGVAGLFCALPGPEGAPVDAFGVADHASLGAGEVLPGAAQQDRRPLNSWGALVWPAGPRGAGSSRRGGASSRALVAQT